MKSLNETGSYEQKALMTTPSSSLVMPAKTARHATVLSLASPAAATSYPFLLTLFHFSMTRSGGGAVVLSVLLLLAASQRR